MATAVIYERGSHLASPQDRPRSRHVCRSSVNGRQDRDSLRPRERLASDVRERAKIRDANQPKSARIEQFVRTVAARAVITAEAFSTFGERPSPAHGSPTCPYVFPHRRSGGANSLAQAPSPRWLEELQGTPRFPTSFLRSQMTSPSPTPELPVTLWSVPLSSTESPARESGFPTRSAVRHLARLRAARS